MLLEFGFKNFFCFKDGVSISYKLDAKCPPNISLGKPFTTVIGVKGANGAGKTHLLKGLAFLSEFCQNSFSYKPEDEIIFESFFEDRKPTEFYVELKLDETIFTYELAVTTKEVKKETIYRKVGKEKKTKIVSRVGGEITGRIGEFGALDTLRVRKNASIISTAHQYEFRELEGIYNFFKSIIPNVNYGGLKETPANIFKVAQFLNEHSHLLSFVREFISSCDTGIDTIDIVKLEGPNPKDIEYAPIFVHTANGRRHPVTEVTESSGTKALFRILPAYKIALEAGGLLILDEFDNHLHPMILPKLLDLFLDPKKNKKNAQLLLSTHDAEILDILGRYRTYLVNKENNESYAYRLDEIPGDLLRNDRSIYPAYKDGKIGGVPRL